MDKIILSMQEYFALRGLSEKTRISYLRTVRQFSEFFSNSPENLGMIQIKEYLLHLLNKNLSKSTIKIAHAALIFLYRVVLERPWEIDKIPRLKEEKRLPVVLNRNEINALLASPRNLKHRAILTVAYSAGLRTSEIANLKVNDIDSSRMQIRIENSKGAKDRYTILSRRALQTLREYWKAYRPSHWLFPNRYRDTPMTYRAIDYIFKRYKKQAGITKPASVHSLRHSFATHLLENGVDLHHIQLLLGHRSPVTTTVYLHVRRVDLQKIISPLDLINPEI